jgi:hypothetical protein
MIIYLLITHILFQFDPILYQTGLPLNPSHAITF